jgi:hypothetical protein
LNSAARKHTRPLPDWQQLPAFHEQQGLRMDKNTAATRGRGEKTDYGQAIDVLFQHAARTPRVSAETR